MKLITRYYNIAILSLIISIGSFTAFLVSNHEERNRFMNFNRYTIPNDDLEQIQSPTGITLSFNKYYSLDSIHINDTQGDNVLSIPILRIENDSNYSEVDINNLLFVCPYQLHPFDEKELEKVRIVERILHYSHEKYNKEFPTNKISITDYINFGLPNIFINKFHKPLLENILNKSIFVRTSNPKSIIKALSFNEVGVISCVHLYNGEKLYIDNPIDNSHGDAYKDKFLGTINNSSKENLTYAYNNRLNNNSLKDHYLEADELAKKHIDEIANTLHNEEIEVLSFCNTNISSIYNKNELSTLSYPNFINWQIIISAITFILFIILINTYYNKKKVYKYVTRRADEMHKKFPNAFNKHKFPSSIGIDLDEKLVELLKRDNKEWEKEELDIINKRINERVAFLKRSYPNGWNITLKKYPIYSNAEMVAIENDIICEEMSFQREKEQKRLEALEIIKRENEEKENKKIKEGLNKLSDATENGDIELAKENIVILNKSIESPTVDKGLINTFKSLEKDFIQKYKYGFSDEFENSYVDYTIPHEFSQLNKAFYTIVKIPKKGTFVFPYRRHKIERRGYMEVSFQKFLIDNFSKCNLLIIGDCAILPANNYRPYEPDIAIIDLDDTSIRIDIEIDEPYSAISKKPIHFIGCGDEFRDMNLNNLGWIVVRFSEYQVLTDMQGCAAFIIQLIHSLNTKKQISSSLLSQNKPIEQKRWTEIEAKVMACEKVRENYLNHKFGIVDSEQVETADIIQTERERYCSKLVKPLIFETLSTREKDKFNKEDFNDRDSKIQFFPHEHIYLYDGKDRFIPVSTIISCFFKPFDYEYWSKYKARKRNVPQGQILEEWDLKGTESRDVGTFMHLQIENYYKGISYNKEYSFKYEGKYINFNKSIPLYSEYDQFLSFLKDHTFKPYRTEWTIYNEELKIAGTIDMINKRGNVFDIYDWKRSHRIVDFQGNPIDKNYYDEKGVGKLKNIDDTPYWHYCIQQNLYRYMLENGYGIKVDKMYLIVFCEDNNDYTKLEVPYMDETINDIIEAYKEGTFTNRLDNLLDRNM